jgi:hypothetical protein
MNTSARGDLLQPRITGREIAPEKSGLAQQLFHPFLPIFGTRTDPRHAPRHVRRQSSLAFTPQPSRPVHLPKKKKKKKEKEKKGQKKKKDRHDLDCILFLFLFFCLFLFGGKSNKRESQANISVDELGRTTSSLSPEHYQRLNDAAVQSLVTAVEQSQITLLADSLPNEFKVLLDDLRLNRLIKK